MTKDLCLQRADAVKCFSLLLSRWSLSLLINFFKALAIHLHYLNVSIEPEGTNVTHELLRA